MKRPILMLLAILWTVPALAGEEASCAMDFEDNTVLQAETTEGVATGGETA